MKYTISKIVSGLVASILVIGCNQVSKKEMLDAKENVKEATQDLGEAVINAKDTAKANAISDWNSFKSESDSTLKHMEKDLAVLETDISKSGVAIKTKIENDLDQSRLKLEELKEKLKKGNIAFENDIDRFDSTIASKNNSFQKEFKHDMNSLRTSFEELFRKNNKNNKNNHK